MTSGEVGIAYNQSAPNQTVGIYCDAVEARVTREDCEDLTRADAQVQTGAAAFNGPERMQRGQTVQVHLVIDRRSAVVIRRIDSEVQREPRDGNQTSGPDHPGSNTAMGNQSVDAPNSNAVSAQEDAPPTPGQVVGPLEGTTERFYPPVGRHMRAELVGQGFEIVAKSAPSQEIPLDGQATWIWDVTAREGGTRSLSLITVVEGVATDGRHVLARRSTVRTVTVEVSLPDRVRDILTGIPGWLQLLTAVLVALGSLFAAWRALWRKRDKPGRNQMPEGSDGAEGSGEG
jgi:hypothetical protein